MVIFETVLFKKLSGQEMDCDRMKICRKERNIMFGSAKKRDLSDFQAYAEQYNELARRLLKHCCSEAEGENVVISPLSILLLLSIAADSTAGKTREEVLSFLGDHEAGQILSKLQKDLSCDHSLAVANAVCVRNDLAPAIQMSYKDQILANYKAELFSSSDLAKDVNAWVERETNGLISVAAPDNIDDVLMCLMNAVAFDAAWSDPYEDEDVRDRYFTNADGTKSRVWMLYGSEWRYIEDDTFTGFRKSYQNSELTFMALLPKKKGKEGMKAAVEQINLGKLCQSSSHIDVHTSMPEFKFEFSKELSDLCKAFGINEAFADAADFSPASTYPLKLDSILHKAFIDINQAGTRAAAVTMAYAVAGCCPPSDFKKVHIDRPFVFAIVDREAGIPVFAGVVNHLEDAKQDPDRMKRRLGRARRLRERE